jgi:hypothetical protein
LKHLSAEELLLAADQELAWERRAHLRVCLSCRARVEKVRAGERLLRELRPSFTWTSPAAKRPAFQQMVAAGRIPAGQAVALLLSVLGIAALAIVLGNGPEQQEEGHGRPQARLTPGATRGIAAKQFCSDRDVQVEIPVEEAKAVFASYGIGQPGPGNYEVDLLIPPALGGVPERRNLWPQPYRAGMWNSRVKDALEDHLLSLVCEGRLDLGTAQRAMAEDWIASYKRYFGVSRPLPDHFAFVKDPAWQ